VRALALERAGDAAASAPAGFLVSCYPGPSSHRRARGVRGARAGGAEGRRPRRRRLSEPDHHDSFALRFQARLKIERAGDYTFALTSDDGSCLYVDGQLVVDNDLDHGMVEKSGSCRLGPASTPSSSFITTRPDTRARARMERPRSRARPLTADSVEAVADDPLRAAAIRVLAARPFPWREDRRRDRAAARGRVPERGGPRWPASVPMESWSAADSAAGGDAVLAFARALPPAQRTRADVLAALDFADQLATQLPGDAARARHDEIVALRGSTILIRTVPHQNALRPAFVRRRRGTSGRDRLPERRPHAPQPRRHRAGRARGGRTAAEALALDPGAQARSFVPELPAVLQKLSS